MNKEVKKRLLWLSEHKTEDVKEDIIYTLDYIRELEREIERLKAIVEGTKENRNELQEEIKRLKEEYVILQNASDEVEEEKDKEIERLQEENTILKQTMSNNSLLINENVLLKSIIKEVRKYIEEMPNNEYIGYWKNEIFEILDKENNNEK